MFDSSRLKTLIEKSYRMLYNEILDLKSQVKLAQITRDEVMRELPEMVKGEPSVTLEWDDIKPSADIHPYRIHEQYQDPIVLPNRTGQVVVLNDNIYHVGYNFTNLVSKETGLVRMDAGYKLLPDPQGDLWPSDNFQAIAYHGCIYIFDNNMVYELGNTYTTFDFSVDNCAILVYHGLIHIIGEEHYTWDGKTITHLGHNTHYCYKYNSVPVKAVVYEDQIHILHGRNHLVYDDDMGEIEFDAEWPISSYPVDSDDDGPFMITYRNAIHVFGRGVHFIWEPDRSRTFHMESNDIDLMIPYKGTMLVRRGDNLFEYDKYLTVYLDKNQILKYPDDGEMPVFYPSDQVEWLSKNSVKIKKSDTYRIYNFDGLL